MIIEAVVAENQTTDLEQSPLLLNQLQKQTPIPVSIAATSCSPSTARDMSTEALSVQTVPMASTAADELSSTFSTTSPEACCKLTLPYENNASGRPIRSHRAVNSDIITLDDPKELEEFMQNGEEPCIAAMKEFITAYSLRQTTVASMTGVFYVVFCLHPSDLLVISKIQQEEQIIFRCIAALHLKAS